MCGIAGLLNARSSSSTTDLGRMVRALSHRGPDGTREVDLAPMGLGHARLSILDPTPAGDQPMSSADGRYHIVHNGEIYNFLELTDQLRSLGWTFRTETDTEVILAAYAAWGPACVERFNGIWALAIWDASRQELFLSRDRLGVKPLYLARSGETWAFASQPRALLELPWVDRTPDPSIVRDFLLDARLDHTDRTFFRGVSSVPAAHNMLLTESGVRTWRYWQPPELSQDPGVRPHRADARLVDEFRDLVVQAISLQLRSDVPVGSCLSGGVDSSSIVAIADGLRTGDLQASGVRHHERDRHPQLAFFADFRDPGIAEREYVDHVVAATGVELRTVSPSSRDFLESLDDVVLHQDEPFGSSSILAQFHVMRLARSAGVSVLLDGQGADELLAGYPAHSAARYGGAVRSRAALHVLGDLLAGRRIAPPHAVAWYAFGGSKGPPTRLRTSRRIRHLLTPTVRTAPATPDRHVELEGTVLAQTLWRLVSSWSLPALLRYEDRNSMAYGIEARVPFLDHRIVEAGLRLPDRLKVDGGETKVVLRRAMRGIVPDPVLDRRDKIGFSAPESRWLRDTAQAVKLICDRPASERAGLLVDGALAQVFAGWEAGGVRQDVFWRVLSLELWVRTLVDGQHAPLRQLAERLPALALPPAAAA